MTLRHMRTFAAVCLEGSVTKAASKLFVSQPSVSLAIQELEAYYQRPLFDRYAKRLYITPFGNEMLKYALEIISMADEMDAYAKDMQKAQRMNIGCGIAFGKIWMPKMVKTFQQKEKNCSIYITVNSFDNLEPLILGNQLDFCIVESTSRSDQMEFEPLLSVPIVGICHADNPLARKRKVTIRDLESEAILLRHRGSPVRMALDLFFSQHNLRVNPIWDSVSALALINAVGENLGISFLPYNHVIALRTAKIHILDVEGLDITQDMHIVYRKGKQFTPHTAAFLQFCRQYLEENDSWIPPIHADGLH